ncbi:hypothetical protein [Frankia sp. AgB32]|uniref:hypothetical protein n=1 Tax=Frankia sp. AgB32 TaxID=631119 RepID=UPI00200BECEE|nr:hypothetical protein [Frankia sp. AgB32]MCK9898367.1 hypothetical protein [Frankia sp. AgB32]
MSAVAVPSVVVPVVDAEIVAGQVATLEVALALLALVDVPLEVRVSPVAYRYKESAPVVLETTVAIASPRGARDGERLAAFRRALKTLRPLGAPTIHVSMSKTPCLLVWAESTIGVVPVQLWASLTDPDVIVEAHAEFAEPVR